MENTFWYCIKNYSTSRGYSSLTISLSGWILLRTNALQSKNIVFGIPSRLIFTVCAVFGMTPYGPRACGSNLSMLPRPFCLRQRLKMVDGPHERVDLRGMPFVLALGRRGAACSAVEQLSFACRLRVAFRIYGMRVGSRALPVVSRIWCQSAGPSEWELWCVRVVGRNGPC